MPDRKELATEIDALDALRSIAHEEDVPHDYAFETRVIRRVRVDRVREGMNYWLPAFMGAFLAFVAVAAALYVVSRPPADGSRTPAIGTAQRMPVDRALPELEPPTRNQ